MRIARRLSVPTGDILVVDGDHGQLECLSIGDYGKDVNLSESPVAHSPMMPLEEKWVITISTQYGCASKCSFCDVPRVGPGRNATFNDMVGQVLSARWLHPEVRRTNRLNVHFARMGEPTWNEDVLDVGLWLHDFDPAMRVHPVVSTMMPKNNGGLRRFLREWMRIKNEDYDGEAGLQLSINTTDEHERDAMFGSRAMTLRDIGALVNDLPFPVGRKVTLNFAVADWPIDPGVLLRHFSPDRYILKLTPMNATDASAENGITTQGEATSHHPYREIAARCRSAGYDVLVFIASREEDESRITCGNAILAGTLPLCEYEEVMT